MPIDTSIYAKQDQPKVDIGNLLSTAIAGQSYQGRDALGKIYQQATRPDGTIDPAALGRLGPQAGIYAPEVAAQAQQRQLGQQSIDSGKMANLRQWWETLDREVYNLINDPDLEGKKVDKAIYGLIGHKDSELNGGLFTPQLAVQTAKSFRGPDGQYLAPDQIRKRLAQFHVRVLDHLSASEPIDTGVAQAGNPYGLPPGTPIKMTRGGFIMHDAQQPRGPGGTAAPAGPTAPGEQPAAPGPSSGGAPVIPGGLGPGVASSQEQLGQGSGKVLSDDLTRAKNYRASVNPMEQAIKLLQDKKVNTGPGSDTLNQIKSFLQTMGFNPGKPWESVTKFDEAKKYLADWINQNGNSQNIETLHSAISGSPNVGISKAANVDIAKVVLALRRMQHHQTVSYADLMQSGARGPDGTPFTPDKYTAWASTWNPQQDPRVYAFDLMPKTQRQKLMKELQENGQWDRFKKAVMDVEKRGIINGPQ